MAEWLQLNIFHLSELNDVEEKKNVLSEIKIKLGNQSNREAEQISRNVDFGQLFTQLTSNDRYNKNDSFFFFFFLSIKLIKTSMKEICYK